MLVPYHLDYCSITYPVGAISPAEIGDLLIGESDFGFKQVGGSIESPWLQSPLGIFMKMNNGSKERPISVQIQGAGCSHFEILLPLLFKEGAWITRLDFCFDLVMTKAAWKQFVAKAFLYSLDREDGTKKSYLKFKTVGDGLKSTIYVGSRSSGKYFRIYNKTAQNPLYTACDVDGNTIDVPEDCCLIRYEVELHPLNDRKSCVDLVDLFPVLNDYISGFDDRMTERLQKYWGKISEFVLLPKDFQDYFFVSSRLQRVYDDSGAASDAAASDVHRESLWSKIKNFVQIRTYVTAHNCDYPRTFDDKLWWMVTHYGGYVPWILRDPHLLRICYHLCREKFGYSQEFYVEPKEILNYDLDELEPPDEYIPECWVQDSFDDIP